MFQKFDAATAPGSAAEKVAQLRAHLQRAKLDAYIVPRADEHQGEYVAPRSERLKWLTGFSGSAGVAVIGRTKAALFVDGRYTVQARFETDATLFAYPGIAQKHLADWLRDTLKSGGKVGFDPWLMTLAEFNRVKTAIDADGIHLKPVSKNLIDKVWGHEQPGSPEHPIRLHETRFAGTTAENKIADVQKILKDANQDYVILTQPDSIAWLLNIRGQDIPHTPVALGFAIVPRTGKTELFVSSKKVPANVRSALKSYVKFSTPETLASRLRSLKAQGKVARLDPATTAYWFHRTLGAKTAYLNGPDPCLALKARKNAIEIEGSRAAHQRDGQALVRFLSWLDDTVAQRELDEIAVVKKLESLRAETGALQEISFDTICGSGPNGAIVHYRVTTETNRSLKSDPILLIDSGAQYFDGTTDITRTIAIGKITSAMKRHYSLVLKGHIAIASAYFPVGTRGIDLDPLARRALWQYGLDYDHGTGHGVGSFLSVHEGPQSISRAGMVALEPGMILSNEPGYYKEGAYGIRIENLELVKPAERLNDGDREMLSFETLTLVPYDRRLIDISLLTREEIDWIDAYHKRVRNTLSKGLSAGERRWLKTATDPL